MSDCPHCRRFREERDEALETARHLRSIAFDRDNLVPALERRLSLTTQQASVLAFLVQREHASKQGLHDCLYSGDPNGGAAPKIIDILVCRIRKALRPHGIAIETVWGQGWRMDAEDKARLRGLIGWPT